MGNLCLTRRPGETIVIGNDITVTVIAIGQDKVKLAIAAPKEVPVHRGEVYELIHAAPAVEPGDFKAASAAARR